MNFKEFRTEFEILSTQSKWDTLWVNLAQCFALGSEKEDVEFSSEVIGGFIGGQVPAPELVWSVLEKSAERAKAKGHDFNLVAVTKRADGGETKDDVVERIAIHAAEKLMRELGIKDVGNNLRGTWKR